MKEKQQVPLPKMTGKGRVMKGKKAKGRTSQSVPLPGFSGSGRVIPGGAKK